MSTPLLSVQNICAGYGVTQVLHNISLEVNSGDIVALIGANGAGKSTLLMSLFGCPRIKSGNILFNGEPLQSLATHAISKRNISLVPEGRHVFPDMTVKENLLLGMVAHGKLKACDLEWIYHLFPLLKTRQSQRAGTLSGGEQQMLAIGRGLISKPKMLLLDEPSLGLAPIMVAQIFTLLQSIATDGTTLFLVEQNAHYALNLAKVGYVLVNGEITLSGSASKLRANPEIRNAYLGGSSQSKYSHSKSQ